MTQMWLIGFMAQNTAEPSKKDRTIVSPSYHAQGFPGGAVVRNPLANAGDTGSSLGLGRSHMSQSN